MVSILEKMKTTIEKAYQLFQGYTATSPLDICTHCCMDIEDERLLASLPVREIPKELLMEYNDGAGATIPPIDELKHFLPRYLELLGDFQFPSRCVELALRKFESLKKVNCTNEEADLLESFSYSFFKKCLSVHPLPENEMIDSILIMFWRGKFDLSVLFKIWFEIDSIPSTLHFIDLWVEGFYQNKIEKMTNPFGDKELGLEIRGWINQEETRATFSARIEQLVMKNVEMNYFESIRLNMVYNMLTALK